MATRLLCALMISGLLFASACENEGKPALPPCVWSKIKQIQAGPRMYPPRSVVRIVTTDGQVYFHITAGCCDFPSTLLDENCNFVCELGGWGPEDNCPEYTVEKSTVVWSDPREIPWD